MRRRLVLRRSAAAATVLLVGSMAPPARAFLLPPPVVIVGVFFSVAFRRYVVAPFMAWLARAFPRLFASELRKYLLAVAVALGLEQAKAAVVAERAEDRGAVDLARDGYERITELTIRNDLATPLELVRMQLALVDEATKVAELVSTASWGLVVAPESTMVREIVTARFPMPGIKRWYLFDRDRTLAVSKPFMVVA